ncbi:MAG: phosphoesterase [Epsilonproteobacteria bacterium]|nr:phosphoesterase [Campylobacterota bacterium]
MIPSKQIDASRHILIKSDKKNLPQASVLYSYLLSRHKKVSCCADEADKKFSFLPWFEKIRVNCSSSADLEIDANIEIMDLYNFLQESDVKINAKMATALYAGFLLRYKNFLSDDVNGTVFAALGQLITFGAEHKLCVTHLCKNTPLRHIRLKAILFEKCLLKENAKVASVSIDDADLLRSGVSMEEATEAAKELLDIVHVEAVELVKSDENIIKIIKDV